MQRAAALVTPIGVVRSPCQDRRQMPGEGVQARIEVRRPYLVQLTGVALSSHLIVLGWFDAPPRPHRPGDAWPVLGAPPRGAFATRTPARPNRLSLTVVRVVAVDRRGVEVDGLDLVDGTPVLDLKPYIPGQDSVFSATRAFRSRTLASRERLAGYLRTELANHLGRDAEAPAARAALDAVLDGAASLHVDPRDPRLHARVNRANAAADALMALLGATLASGRLVIAPDERPLRISLWLGAEPGHA